ncbi:MAG: cation:proton antiporter [Chthoniobacterales bacterium]
MHATLLQDLAVVMVVAAFVTVLFRRLKQPVVLGYILAGLIVGPHTPPFPLIQDRATIETLSELGVVFLMFALGLEFSLRKLKKVGMTALIAASLEILVMVLAGYELGRFFGWSLMNSVFLGAILSISSTTIIIKALEELGKTREHFAQLILGILIVEDILAIVMIALLSGFATTGSLAPGDIAITMLRLSAFLGTLLVLGLIIVPRLLDYVARFKSNEMLLITVLGLCFGVSLIAVKLGYSVALGAFLIGAIIAEARQIVRIENLMHPIRDMFSAVFFVSIGLLIDPALLVKYIVPILVISVVVIVGKVLACSFGSFIAGNDRRSSLQVGMGLAQIGEFSFIIATLGLTLRVTSDFLYPIAVAVSVLTTLATPYLVKSSDAVAQLMERILPRPLLDSLDTYTRWVGQRSGGTDSPAVRLLRRWAWQIGINLLLVTAIFLGAVYLRPKVFVRWPDVPGGIEGLKAFLWLGAMLLALPLFIAVIRKLQAAAMLISEITVHRDAAGERTEALRAIIVSVVMIAGSLALILIVLLLSSTILPSWKMLIALGLLLVAAFILLRRPFIRLYAGAQFALQTTLSQPEVARQAAPLPPLLSEASLRTVSIPTGSPAIGKLIAELQIRSQTGASIVGIERENGSVLNPGPDEELHPGDRLIFLGHPHQLAAAEGLIAPIAI